MEQLPLFLDLKSKSCLLVGAGDVAERKARLLLRAGGRLTVIAPSISDYFESLDRAQVTISQQAFAPNVCEGHHLIIAATNCEAVNRAVADAAQRLGIWCNVVDRPALSSVFFPAMIDRSPVTIAIGTGGHSPTLARWLKRRIEAGLPSRLSILGKALGRWRQHVQTQIKDAAIRQRFFERILDGPVARHVLAGRVAEAEAAFAREIKTPREKQGEAYLVGAGPGDVGLLTLRGHQLLSQADIVLYDALVSEDVLEFTRRDAKRVCVGKRPGESHKQAGLTQSFVGLVKKGYRVCRLKGGDPFIFGRGGEEIQALAEAGLPFEVVPGITAAQGCAASAGIALTFRNIASSVTLATGSVGKGNEPDWALLARPGQTLALYMSMASLEMVSANLIAAGLAPHTPAAVVEKGTLEKERIVDATLAGIAEACHEHSIGSPAMLFVGKSVALRASGANKYNWNRKDVLLFQNVMSA